MPNNNSLGGRLTFPAGMQIPYTPRANPINLTNPFTRPDLQVGFKPFQPVLPPSVPPVTNPSSIPAQNPPTQEQAQQTPITMPNSLLKNPVAQAFSNPVQQPQRPKIYIPDFMGRRGRPSNWSDAYSIANLR